MMIIGLFGSHHKYAIVLRRSLQASILTQSPIKKNSPPLVIKQQNPRGAKHIALCPWYCGYKQQTYRRPYFMDTFKRENFTIVNWRSDGLIQMIPNQGLVCSPLGSFPRRNFRSKPPPDILVLIASTPEEKYPGNWSATPFGRLLER